ncbi:MAG TPA: PilT/PilU family type 4a pilus ATPase [Candidatus Dojkabacteria bacterium]|nr:PilT/PilU family type 4a pilus ATPase [Candidatus Dojkabacteria bacterium]
MTAQDQNNNDPKNTNAAPVPAGSGMMVSGPSFPNDTKTMPINPLSTSDDPAIGTTMTGLTPNIPSDPMTPVSPVDPMIPENAAPTVNASENVVNSNSDNASSGSASSNPTQSSDDKKDEDTKESPLESLAKKLAQLKSEFVEEVPETTPADAPKQDEKPMEESNAEPMPENKDLPPVVGNDVPESLKDAMKLPPELSQPTVETPTPATEVSAPILAQTPLSAPIVDETKKPEIEASVLTGTSTPLDPEQQPSDSAVIPQTPLSNGNSSDTAVVDDILKQYETELHGSPDSPNTPVNAPTPEPLVTPATPVTESPKVDTDSTATGSEQLLNENDNSQVREADVELRSQNTKYPISINKILDEAIERNASDVLISVGYPVMIRIDGTLVAVNEYVVSAANSKELILPVLTEQKKELLEVNREVDLAYTHRHNGEARFRINAFYTQDNLAAAFRLIPTRIRTIEELNLPPILNQFTNLKQGLILVTGPTGHGKSTTLAAMIQAINTNRSVHILTIEDPIEYIFPKAKAVVDQREMHDDTHSWDIALKSALRQNPDVILVGEMRDYETISSTITLAETGHLVFATLHTNSAAQTIDRIIDVFPENQQAQVRSQLSSIMQAVIAQRLIPIEGGGRRAVCEIMLGTPAVNNLIREGKTQQLDNVIRTSADVGMNALEHSLVALVREGLITVDKAQEYAVHPEEIIRLLKS